MNYFLSLSCHRGHKPLPGPISRKKRMKSLENYPEAWGQLVWTMPRETLPQNKVEEEN